MVLRKNYGKKLYLIPETCYVKVNVYTFSRQNFIGKKNLYWHLHLLHYALNDLVYDIKYLERDQVSIEHQLHNLYLLQQTRQCFSICTTLILYMCVTLLRNVIHSDTWFLKSLLQAMFKVCFVFLFLFNINTLSISFLLYIQPGLPCINFSGFLSFFLFLVLPNRYFLLWLLFLFNPLLFVYPKV